MEKVTIMNEDQIKVYGKSGHKKEYFKHLIGHQSRIHTHLGDTAAKIPKAKVGEIYKEHRRGKTTYYMVVKVIDQQLAFTHTLSEL